MGNRAVATYCGNGAATCGEWALRSRAFCVVAHFIQRVEEGQQVVIRGGAATLTRGVAADPEKAPARAGAISVEKWPGERVVRALSVVAPGKVKLGIVVVVAGRGRDGDARDHESEQRLHEEEVAVQEVVIVVEVCRGLGMDGVMAAMA